jgi:hypothetical protein
MIRPDPHLAIQDPQHDPQLRRTLDRYFDVAPRHDADQISVGPFTVFVSRSPWPYYARPAVDRSGSITVPNGGGRPEGVVPRSRHSCPGTPPVQHSVCPAHSVRSEPTLG